MGYGNSNLGSEYIFHHLPSGKCPSINYMCVHMYVHIAKLNRLISFQQFQLVLVDWLLHLCT